jgi:general secretion pathway protein N
MRSLRLDARGWLWAVAAAWALLCAIVALLGFGGRYQLLADDPSKVQPLPAIAKASTAPVLGPLENYAAASKRPLFYPDRKPIAVHVPGQNSSAQPLNVVLTSVIITPSVQMAIVQDVQTHVSYRAKQGQSLDGPYSAWKLVSVSPRAAVFESGQGQTTLELRVFNGQGGELPTRMGLTPEVVASGALGPPLPNAAMLPPNPNVAPQLMSAPAPPPPPPVVATPEVASDVANAAANATRQAEMIRQRIEQRRREAQAQNDVPSSPNEKK